MGQNFFDQFDHAGPQGVVLRPANPLKAQREQNETVGSAEDVTSKRLRNQEQQAKAPYFSQIAAADAKKAKADADKAAMEADQKKAETAIADMQPNSQVHGDEYLRKFVPPQMWNTVKAYARGDLGSRSGGLSTSMLPIIQHAMNYDPNASGTNFAARVKMQQDLAGSQPNTAGGALRAMERMLLHGQEVLRTGNQLNNYGEGFLGSIGNAIRTGYEHFTHDHTVAGYEERVRNYAPEAQKAIAQTTGGVGERGDREAAFSASLPQSARAAALQGDARQALDAMNAVNNQYRRLMGRDILDALSPEAKRAYNEIMAGGYDGQGNALHPAPDFKPLALDGQSNSSNGAPPTVGGGGGMDRTPQINPSSGGGTQTQVATKDGQTFDPVTAGAIERMILAKKSPAEIQAAFPDSKIDPAQIAAAQAYAASHPGYHGFVNATKPQNLTGFQQLSASPLAAYFAGAGNAATLGFNDEIGGIGSYLTGGDYTATRDRLDANKKALAALNPKSDFLGNLAGGAAVDTLAGGLLPPGIANAGKGPFQARDAVIGGIYGAGENNDNRLGGATGGATLGGLAGGAGRTLAIPVGAASRRIGGMMGRTGPAPLSPGETAVMNAVDKASIPDVQAQLSEAQSLGVPMSLADTHPELTSLGGAAVRRSPTADKVAQDALLPRSRGQIDRFGQAINRDLGPTGNVPLLSDNLEKAASAQAKPLYQEAYGAGQVNDPQINTLLQHPVLRDAFDGAQQLHANDVALAKAKGEQPPPPLAQVYEVKPGAVPGTNDPVLADKFAPSPSVTPEAFNVVTPPDVRTIDYIKRSLDRQIEAAYAGDSKAKMNLPFLKGARELLLSRTDSAVPAYGKARAAYGGNMDASEALQAGKAGVTADPNEFGMTVGDTAPGNIPQLQLGFRSGLLDQGNRLRYSTNPFEAVLGTPAAEQRLATAFPNSEGVPNLLRQRDMERQLARSTNDVLGNSKTAQRGIADQAFGESGLPNMLLDAGVNLATGQVPTGLLFKKGALDGIKGVMKMGVGKRAVAKADEIAPILFNTDPTAASASLDDLTARNLAYQAYVNASRARPRQVLGMLGAQSARQWAGGN